MRKRWKLWAAGLVLVLLLAGGLAVAVLWPVPSEAERVAANIEVGMTRLQVCALGELASSVRCQAPELVGLPLRSWRDRFPLRDGSSRVADFNRPGETDEDGFVFAAQTAAAPVVCPFCEAATLPPGPDESLVSDLLSRWQGAHGRGEDVPAAELCCDRPALVDPLARRSEVIRAVNRLVVSGSAAGMSELPTASGPPDTPSAPTADFAPGRPNPAVPGYVILGELGRGGMGVVYQAHQLGLKRLVALRMIRAGEFAGAAEVNRFQTEAEAIAQLKHPHVVQIYEVGTYNGLPCFTLELQSCRFPGVSRAASAAPSMILHAVLVEWVRDYAYVQEPQA